MRPPSSSLASRRRSSSSSRSSAAGLWAAVAVVLLAMSFRTSMVPLSSAKSKLLSSFQGGLRSLRRDAPFAEEVSPFSIPRWWLWVSRETGKRRPWGTRLRVSREGARIRSSKKQGEKKTHSPHSTQLSPLTSLSRRRRPRTPPGATSPGSTSSGFASTPRRGSTSWPWRRRCPGR